jgi:N-acetylmuramoyl-L-alanine amidase
LSDKLLEKDVTMAFARRIRQEMAGKGFSAALLRDGDTTLSSDQRAGLANAMRPAIYLCVHAAADGKGVRVYTAMFSAGEQSVGPFLPWNEAQVSSLGTSQMVATSITTELGRTFPARMLPASLHPLQNVTAAAVALEIAPRSGNVEDLESEEYQQHVGVAVANALASLREKLGGQQ